VPSDFYFTVVDGSGKWIQYHGYNIDVVYKRVNTTGGTATANVTLRVAVPGGTPLTDTIYVAGTMNFWDPGPGEFGSDGKHHDQPMHNIGQNRWELTLPATVGDTLKYKYARGTWAKGEKGAQGQDIPNRVFLVPKTDAVQLDTVKNWADNPASVADNDGPPAEYQLHQNYPNPFNPSTTIEYTLPRKSNVTLTVYNTLGQLVVQLWSGEQEAGLHEVRFEGGGLTSGVYFYRIQAGDFVQTRKSILMK